MSAEHNQSNGQIFKELPTPKEGITEQVFNEVVTNRDTFIKNELKTINEQNQLLHDFLINVACMGSPDRNLSLAWALAYYAIHSRSTHSEGMLKVSEDVISVRIDEDIQKFEDYVQNLQEIQASDSVLEKRKAPFLENPSDTQRRNLIELDTERSGELGIFWERMRSLEDSLAAYNSPETVDRIVESTYAVSALLHAQVEVDRLKQQFPGI